MRAVFLSLGLFILALTGCASTLTRPSPLLLYPKNYALNESAECTVGSSFLRVGRVLALPAFVPVNEFEAPSGGVAGSRPVLAPSQVWVARYGDAKLGGYVLTNERFPGRGIHISSDGSVGEGWVGVPSGKRTRVENWPSGPLFAPIEAERLDESFEAELLFLGVRDDVLRLLYREFSDNRIRPAFQLDVEYDLAVDRIVEFRPFRIEVLEFTSSRIRYRVLDDGGLSWL